jgi:hypothetical protein
MLITLECSATQRRGSRIVEQVDAPGQGGHALPTSSRRFVPTSVKKRAALVFCAYRWTQNVTEAEPCRFAEIKKASNGWSTKKRSVHKPIGQRLHEENERVLFCIGQTQMTNFARVHIGGRFRRWLGGRAFARIMGLAARQHIARVLSTMVIS